MANADPLWEWFQRYGFSEAQYRFATARDTTGMEVPPPTLLERYPNLSPTVPALTPEEHSLARDQYHLNTHGTKLPPDWPVRGGVKRVATQAEETSRTEGEKPESK